jgi:hypothetical protein
MIYLRSQKTRRLESDQETLFKNETYLISRQKFE